MIKSGRSTDFRDRGEPRRLGQQAAPLAIRERAPVKEAAHARTLEECEHDIQSSFARVAAAFATIKAKRLYLERELYT